MRFLLLYLFILITCYSFGQWYPGSMTYTDGQVRSGYLKFFDTNTVPKVEFRTAPGEQVISVEADQLSEIKFIKESGHEIIYLRLRGATVGPREGKLRTERKKTWFALYYRGDFDVVSTGVNAVGYAVHWKGTEEAIAVIYETTGLDPVINKDKLLRDTISAVFRTKCGPMVAALQERTFKPRKIDEIIAFYEKNCAAK